MLTCFIYCVPIGSLGFVEVNISLTLHHGKDQAHESEAANDEAATQVLKKLCARRRYAIRDRGSKGTSAETNDPCDTK